MLVPPTLLVPRAIAVHAVHALAAVDYSVATRVSDEVARVTDWAAAHDQWWLALVAVHLLASLDDAGSRLIRLAQWLVTHAR